MTRRRDITMNEATLEVYFNKRVQGLGGLTLKIAPTTAGAPDRLVLLPGGIIRLVELKTERGKVRPIQFHFHSRCSDIGTPVVVLYGRIEVDDWLRRVVDACGPKSAGQRGEQPDPGRVQPRHPDLIPERHPLL